MLEQLGFTINILKSTNPLDRVSGSIGVEDAEGEGVQVIFLGKLLTICLLLSAVKTSFNSTWLQLLVISLTGRRRSFIASESIRSPGH